MSLSNNNPLTNKKALLMMALMLGSATAAHIRNLNWDDPGCNTFSADGSCCLKCSFRFYMQPNGRCAQVSDHCKTWDEKNGKCTSCYPGYGDPVKGVCSTTPVVGGGTDPDCDSKGSGLVGGGDSRGSRKSNWKSRKSGIVGGGNSRRSRKSDWKSRNSGIVGGGNSSHSHKSDCKSGNSGIVGGGNSSRRSNRSRSRGSRSRSCSLPANCRRANSKGRCIQCVDNYHPVQGVCYPNVGNPPDNTNCAVWGYYDAQKKYYEKWFDGCKKVCKKCNAGFYLDADNNCQVLTGNCLAADVNGNCTQCQAGFCKQDGKCVLRIVQRGNSRSTSKRSRKSHSKNSKGSRSRSRRSGVVGQGQSWHKKKQEKSIGIWVNAGSSKSKGNDSRSKKSHSKSKRSHDSKSRKSANSKVTIKLPQKISIKVNQVNSKKVERHSGYSKNK